MSFPPQLLRRERNGACNCIQEALEAAPERPCGEINQQTQLMTFRPVLLRVFFCFFDILRPCLAKQSLIVSYQLVGGRDLYL